MDNHYLDFKNNMAQDCSKYICTKCPYYYEKPKNYGKCFVLEIENYIEYQAKKRKGGKK